MRPQGRQVLTTLFMWVTGVIVASLLVGSVYFLWKPTLALERLFVLPLLMIAIDMTIRLFTSTNLPTQFGKIVVILGIPALFAVAFKLVRKLRIDKVVLFPMRILLAIRSA